MEAAKTLQMYPLKDIPQILGGYYLKARKIDESEIAHAAPCIREIWDWLIRQCNHKENLALAIKRGQCVRKISDIQDGLHWHVGYRKKTYSKTQCEHALEFLRKKFMITTTKTTRGMIITICNYDSYQNPKNYEDNSDDNKKTTRRQQQGDTINKNGNNVNNGNREGADTPPPKSYKRWTDREFVEDIARYKDQYDRDMLNAFYKHFSEKDDRGKMLLQMKTTWETGKRLATWASREKKYNYAK